jgi:hypothetical protein
MSECIPEPGSAMATCCSFPLLQATTDNQFPYFESSVRLKSRGSLPQDAGHRGGPVGSLISELSGLPFLSTCVALARKECRGIRREKS